MQRAIIYVFHGVSMITIPLSDKLSKFIYFLFFSLTCGHNRYQICASYYILWEKNPKKQKTKTKTSKQTNKTLKTFAHFPIDLYSKRTSAASK